MTSLPSGAPKAFACSDLITANFRLMSYKALSHDSPWLVDQFLCTTGAAPYAAPHGPWPTMAASAMHAYRLRNVTCEIHCMLVKCMHACRFRTVSEVIMNMPLK